MTSSAQQSMPAIRGWRVIVFAILRFYVAIEQCAFVKWLRGVEPDVILEPLAQPGDDVPEVHTAPSVFVAADLRSAYTHDAKGTLRRVAEDEGGQLVYIRKASKREKRAMKRGTRRNAAAVH